MLILRDLASLGCYFVEVLVSWDVRSSGHWFVGVLVLRDVGSLGCWSFRMLVRWGVASSLCWFVEVLVRRNDGKAVLLRREMMTSFLRGGLEERLHRKTLTTRICPRLVW